MTKLFPIVFNEKEMVLVTEGIVDVEKVHKEGWKDVQFVGFASVFQAHQGWRRFFPHRKRIPMYRLTKNGVK